MVSGVRTPYEEAVSDFEAAFERLVKASGHEDEQRRAWLEATNHTFRIREHIRGRYEKKAGKGSYYPIADAHEFGKATEGILVVRNIATHVLTVRANPRSRPSYPGSRNFPSKYLRSDDKNLFWLKMHELDVAAREAVSRGDIHNYYRDHVAGLLVLGTLQAVREFLINDVTISFT